MSAHPLKSFREKQAPPISQAELAKLLGVTKATISRWESGERFPEREHWPIIQQITGISLQDLHGAAA